MLLYTRDRVPGPQTNQSAYILFSRKKQLTLFQGIDSTSKRQLIRTDDTSKDGQKTASNPPSNGVTQEVNLLPSVALGPEAHTSEEEWPLEGLTSIWVAAGQGVVVKEHGPLKFKVLPKKGQLLGLAFLPDQTRTVLGQALDRFRKPQVAGLQEVLVTVDFGLLETPVWQRCRVCPHADTSGNMDQFEVT